MIIGVSNNESLDYLYNRVPRVSTPQDGVFSREQALSAGFTRSVINRKIRQGLWVRAAGSGLIEQGEPITVLQLANALALTWPDATVIGPSAVQLWYMTAPLPNHETLMCAVPRQRRPRLGLVPRVMQLPASDVTEWRHGIMIQRRHSALVDALAWLPRDQADSLFGWMMARRLIGSEEYAALLIARVSCRGVVRLREYQRWLDSGAASLLEFRVHCLLRAAGIDGWEANAPVTLRGGERRSADILFKKHRLVIEVDGRRFHQTVQAFNADRIRDNQYHSSGYQTLRVTWQMIEQTPDQFLADLRALLAIQQSRNKGRAQTPIRGSHNRD